ncbi:polysaccharide biosynthesis/export family protein [Microvirga sp. BT689]|uniref:polysaccharide biosynthesis/export family protein n=1 Tax=Microvirga arvi TaxID=2778731 RepID=UPI0019511D30|nr:polysaccharide biosynthesis/export family protein [Microvirga arvi]MBM6584154.1 polysaccharide biosynthesis/export family protein [Microvirga arvi]
MLRKKYILVKLRTHLASMHTINMQSLCIATISTILAVLPTGAKAGFRLNTGDAVEISIAGVPELKTRATIDLDGNVMVPVVGSVPAAGLSIGDLLEKLRAAFANRAISVRGVDGRTVITPVAQEDVSVSIAEYRPVYISGDITRAGEVPYRPGLIVRQAIAIAGSYDIARLRSNNPYIEAVNYNAEYALLMNELQQEEERKQLIYNELNMKGDDKAINNKTDNVDWPQRSYMAEQFRAQDVDFQNDVAHLRRTTEQIGNRSSALDEKKTKEEEGLKADIEDFERSKALLEKGTTSIQRVTDARRAMLLSATRALQTEVEAARATLEKDQIARSMQKLQDQRRIRIFTELQDNAAKIRRIQTQLKAVKGKLTLVGALKSAWNDSKMTQPQIVVHRTDGKQREQIAATEDTPLMPGDSVEVILPLDQF